MGNDGETGRLDALLATREVVVMDGGMGSTVEDRGMRVRGALWGSTALLTASGRELNDSVHRDFREAGAELLITNTHNAWEGACRALLETEERDELEPALRDELEGLSLDDAAARLCERVNALAVESLRRVAGDDTALAGCLASPKPAYATEGPDADEVARRLASQARALARHDLDLVVFELLTTEGDLRGCARLAAEMDLANAAIGLTCREDGRTLAGVAMEEAVALTAEARPAAYFVQCTRHDAVLPTLERLLAATAGGAVVGVYANDCRVWRDRRWHGERVSPETYSRSALEWKARGARIIGGCCGIGPAHVAALARAL